MNRYNQSAMIPCLALLLLPSIAFSQLRNPEFTDGLTGQAPAEWHIPPIFRANFRAVNAIASNLKRKRCVLLTNTSSQSGGVLRQAVDASRYRGKRVRFRAAVSLDTPLPGAKAQLWMRVDRPDGRVGFFDNMYYRPIISCHWRSYEIIGDVAPDATRILCGIIVNGQYAARMTSASLTILKTPSDALPRPTNLDSFSGPGILDVHDVAAVAFANSNACRGQVTFPIPSAYRTQTPLTFRVSTLPSTALQSYRWVRRPDGVNTILQVTVARPPKSTVVIEWEMLVLVTGEHEAILRKTPLPVTRDQNLPTEWLKSTRCVQSDDPQIQAKAAELATGAGDIETYVRRVIQFTSANQGKPGAPFTTLDARAALDCGGSCTSRANLAAALLRAKGIPARTVAHLPAWGGQLYEHWLVEYWHPGSGWVSVESTLGKWRPSPETMAVLAIANPNDEDRSFAPENLRYVVAGAPYLNVPELSEQLKNADLAPYDCANYAAPAARIHGSHTQLERLIRTAGRAYKRMTKLGEQGKVPNRTRRILAAAATGRPDRLSRSLQQ
ncbi:MAG: transglutaminase-like domain-containing protein [Capsulimonadaceae bacterium]|nr:transglutaminase-like domain-containing protein [Capsulimonadaceae bacterium]